MSSEDSVADLRPSRLPLAVWLVAGAVALVQFLSAGHYGIFRDELYYIACSRHLDWGYVDQPPLSIFFLWLWKPIAGDHLALLRLPAMVAMAAVSVLTAVLARDMGGNRWAQVLAAAMAAFCPIFLGFGGFYSMNAFDALFWVLAFICLARLITTEDPAWWFPFALICGLGLMNKMGMAFFGAGLVVAMVLTPLRRHFLNPQLYIGGAIAAILFLPYVMWMWRHDWAPFEFMHNARTYKNAETTPLGYFLELILTMHPVYFLFWTSGLVYLLIGKYVRPFRPFAIIWVFLFFFFSLQNGKAYYLAPAFPPLFAAGAILSGNWAARRKHAWPGLAVTALVCATGALLVPMAVPVLSPAGYQQFETTLGIAPPAAEKGHVGASLPQHFGDRFGWPELADAVAEAYQTLPEEERAHCVILGGNYGDAGAIDYFGPALGLPPAYAFHNNYWFWGPPEGEIKTVIAIGNYSDESLDKLSEHHRFVKQLDVPYAMAKQKIFVLRGLKIPVEELWAKNKNFI